MEKRNKICYYSFVVGNANFVVKEWLIGGLGGFTPPGV